MKFIEFLKNDNYSKQLLNNLLIKLFPTNYNDYKFVNYGHYFAIKGNDYRAEIFKSGYI